MKKISRINSNLEISNLADITNLTSCNNQKNQLIDELIKQTKLVKNKLLTIRSDIYKKQVTKTNANQLITTNDITGLETQFFKFYGDLLTIYSTLAEYKAKKENNLKVNKEDSKTARYNDNMTKENGKIDLQYCNNISMHKDIPIENKENLLNIKNHNSNEINNKTNIKIPIHHLDIKNNNKAKTNSTETIEEPIVNIDENNNYTIYESKMAQSQLKTYEQMRNSNEKLVKQPTQSQKEAQKFFREKTDFNKNRNKIEINIK